ncbi:hypothetical protein B0H14DRAFT_3165829 [Mycena olivaceomarginata]|nr:hypothetical protein B0H14DRAFT_3165829 [Mycena olivaceomarginata]
MPAERQDELGLGHVGRAEGFCRCSRFAGGCSVSSSSDSPLSTASVESSIAGVIVYSAEKVKHGAAASVLVRARTRLNPVSHTKTLRCCAFIKEVIYRTWPPPLAPHRDIGVSTRFDVARTRTCPGRLRSALLIWPRNRRPRLSAPQAPAGTHVRRLDALGPLRQYCCRRVLPGRHRPHLKTLPPRPAPLPAARDRRRPPPPPRRCRPRVHPRQRRRRRAEWCSRRVPPPRASPRTSLACMAGSAPCASPSPATRRSIRTVTRLHVVDSQ